jgi:RNA polymerase sigma-70 factor (ECF subfamily)
MIDADAELMLRFREGDRSAFEQLFHRYTPPLVNFLARMVPERARAEELAQEVFVRIYGARDRYEPRAKFSTFMFGIAHRLALNELARAHRRREQALGEGGPAEIEDPSPRADAVYDASRTAEQIAAVLETSTASVKSLLHRARETLASRLEEEIS